jgi:hypothetical protein
MTATDLDDVYTELCQTMTRLGEERAQLFLARFALLAIVRIDQAASVRAMIAEAAEIIAE